MQIRGATEDYGTSFITVALLILFIHIHICTHARIQYYYNTWTHMFTHTRIHTSRDLFLLLLRTRGRSSPSCCRTSCRRLRLAPRSPDAPRSLLPGKPTRRGGDTIIRPKDTRHSILISRTYSYIYINAIRTYINMYTRAFTRARFLHSRSL